MKWYVLVSLSAILLFGSCAHKSGIEYSKVASIDMGNLKKENARFAAIIAFNNISENPFVVKNLVLDLKIDGKDIGTILVKNPKEVRPNSEFTLETNYMYESGRLLKPGEEPAEVYLIQLEGELTLKDKNGEELTVPVKYKASYAYLTKKEERIEMRRERREQKKKDKETGVIN
jgi:LEA14-like dessication related protein